MIFSKSPTGLEAYAPALFLQGTPPLEQLKLQYYYHMIRYHLQQKTYLEVARAYRAIFDTLPHVGDDFVSAEPAGVVLKKVCWFAVLAPRHTDEQVRCGDGLGNGRVRHGMLAHGLLTFCWG